MFRIVNWDDNFENNRSRGLKKLDWVPVPNKLGGDGYTELLDHPNGAAHYGAWCGILLLASRCDVRGTLARDVGAIRQEGAGSVRRGARPHDARSISRLTRIPLEVIEEAIPRLIEIGWLEVIDPQTVGSEQVEESRQQGVTIRQEGAGERPRKRREEKGIEREIANSLGGEKQEAEPRNGQVFHLDADEIDTAVARAIQIRRKVPCRNKSEALALCRIAALEIRTLATTYVEDAAEQTRRKSPREPPGYFVEMILKAADERGESLRGTYTAIVFPPERVQEVLEAAN